MNTSEWISAAEKLPQLGERVLVWYEWADQSRSRHSIAIDDMVINDRTLKPRWRKHPLSRNVTHWMPLPKPPKEEDDDD